MLSVSGKWSCPPTNSSSTSAPSDTACSPTSTHVCGCVAPTLPRPASTAPGAAYSTPTRGRATVLRLPTTRHRRQRLRRAVTVGTHRRRCRCSRAACCRQLNRSFTTGHHHHHHHHHTVLCAEYVEITAVYATIR